MFYDKKIAFLLLNSKKAIIKILKEIYFHSVGRNGVLLLNIPPDKRGLITDFDLAALKNWRKKLDEIFRVNLLKGAKGVKEKKKINIYF